MMRVVVAHNDEGTLRVTVDAPHGTEPFSCAAAYRNAGGGLFHAKLRGLIGAHGTVGGAVPADFESDGFPDVLPACPPARSFLDSRHR
jgi:hypothetical protein